MGYDVHITRAEHWTESKSNPITLDDWLRYIDGDPEIRLDNVVEVVSPGGDVLCYENNGLAVWTAYSKHGQKGGMAWFDHRFGMIVVKNPDDEIVDKMRRIAWALNAKVMGDEGESY